MSAWWASGCLLTDCCHLVWSKTVKLQMCPRTWENMGIVLQKAAVGFKAIWHKCTSQSYLNFTLLPVFVFTKDSVKETDSPWRLTVVRYMRTLVESGVFQKSCPDAKLRCLPLKKLGGIQLMGNMLVLWLSAFLFRRSQQTVEIGQLINWSKGCKADHPLKFENSSYF